MAGSESVQDLSSLDDYHDDGYSQLIQALNASASDPAHPDVIDEFQQPSFYPESVPASDPDSFIDGVLSQLRLTLKSELEQFRHQVFQECDEKMAIRTGQQQSEMKLATQKIQQLQELAAKLQICYNRAECRDQHRLLIMADLTRRWHTVRAVSQKFHHWLSASRRRCRLRLLEDRYSIPTERRSLKRRQLNRWKTALNRAQKAKREGLFKSQLDSVSGKLVSTYEANLQAMRAELVEAKLQIAFLTQNRERMEREMKQAFLRSVSALNLEAMSIFPSKPGEPNDQQFAGEDLEPRTNIPQPSSSDNTRDLP